MGPLVLALAAVLPVAFVPANPPAASAIAQGRVDGQEVVAEVRVHGNVATGDDEVRRLAGLQIGVPLRADTLADVAARLRATGKFTRVEVLKRFASISDPSQIVVVIVVDEGAVAIQRTGDLANPTRIVKKRGPRLMFLPVLRAEDGYGAVYGAQVGLPNPAGKDSRLTFPLTWGGDKRAAVELSKDYDAARTRLSAGAGVNRRTHPFFEQDEDRQRVWARGEREIGHSTRIGATAGWQHVAFAVGGAGTGLAVGGDDSFAHAGADVVVDTRLDPMLARNAIYARAAWDRFSFRSGDANDRSELEGRAYVGLVGQTVLVLRAVRDDARKPLPGYLQPILGGLANLRGFRAGTAIGDTLTAGSAEIRMPLTSPLDIAKLGVSAFVDVGAAGGKGTRLADQTLERGIGGSIWVSAAFLRLNLAVAHGLGSSTRVHVGGGLTF